MADRSEHLREFFSRYVTALGGARDLRIEAAFAVVRRERFVGPGPWSINLPGTGYFVGEGWWLSAASAETDGSSGIDPN